MFRRAVLIVALATLLACGCQPYSRSTSGVSALDKQVLYDFRNPAFPTPAPLDKATQHRVLSAVSARYYDSVERCPSGKHAGEDVVLQLTGAANGSFTAPAAAETAYLVAVTNCGEHRAFPTNRLLVFAGDHTVAGADTRYSHILKTCDLNGDHVTELLLGASDARMSDTTTEASLVRFDKKALLTLENFGSVYHDGCGGFQRSSAEPGQVTAKAVGAMVDALVISYLPRPGGQMPSFFAQRYHAPCSPVPNEKPTSWQPVGN